MSFSDIKDLLSQFHFESEQGKIWLGEQRMLMFRASVMGLLRKELVQTLGVERAKGFLLRFGYHTGMKDAELGKTLRPDLSSDEAFLVGPQLHSITGQVNVEPVALKFDIDKGEFYGEFNWFESYEAEQHLAELGLSDEPVCWTLLGYASGYTTYYMGRSILFKETQCRGSGAEHCRIVGKTAEEWEDREEQEKFLFPDPIIEKLFSLQNELSELKDNIRQQDQEHLLCESVGRSNAFKNVCTLVAKASKSRVTVLLLGETGVGKEVVAKSLHMGSDRADKAFVAVNCAAIPPDLIEAELFGVEKGAYTGATSSREGKFERANQGTIFLDEVIELSAHAQATLLRVLQEGELERVGDNRTRRIDVRVLAATNENLEEAVREGRFRADLFYRLNVYPIHIPPLRDRVEDIPLFVEYFLEKYQSVYNKRIQGVSDRAMQAFIEYKWPGNIRELENIIERGIILTDNNENIGLNSLFPSLNEPSHPLNMIDKKGFLSEELLSSAQADGDDWMDHLLESDDFDLEQFNEILISKSMERAEGNVSKAARSLGLSRPALAYRLKKMEEGAEP